MLGVTQAVLGLALVIAIAGGAWLAIFLAVWVVLAELALFVRAGMR